jgi:hypothetical protein
MTFDATIAGEAQRLAALLTRNVPGAREPVSLPDSDPPAVRAFWTAVGWNPKWPREFRLHHPDAQKAARELPRLLEQLAEESPDSPALEPGGLPRAFRIADVDRDGVGFILTDEDDPQRRGDPRLVGVVFDTGEKFEPPISYLSWCADELLAVAFAGWFQEHVPAADVPAAAVETPFPVLSPTTRVLAPEVWLLPADPYAPPSGERLVAFAAAGDFTRAVGRPPRQFGR